MRWDRETIKPMILPPEIKESLNRLLIYLEEEREDYSVNGRENHIYQDVEVVRRWVEKNKEK